MKDQFKNIRLAIFVLLSSILLQACGGSSDNTPTFSISTNVSKISFDNEFLQEKVSSLSFNVTFDGNGLLLGFAPDAQPVAWLNYRIEDLTATSATIHVDVVNANQMIANLYGTTLRLSTGDTTTTNLAHADIDVSLLIWQALTFDDTFGVNELATKQIQVSSTADDLTVSANVPWLSVSKSFLDGVTTINATPNLSSITESGLYLGEIAITSVLGTTNYPVELSLDNIHLFSETSALSFVKTLNINDLRKTLTINSNSVLPWGWQATSDVAWLTLSANAETNQLTINADPASLADNETSSATITITGDETTTAIAEVITVNLYKSNTETKNDSLSEIISNSNGIVSNPALPTYYVAVANELRSYHLYTNELLNTTTIAPTDSMLEQLIIHPQGHLLLAKADEIITLEDETTETVTHRYQVNLNDMSVTELENENLDFEPVKFVRIDGRYFVVSQVLEFADENLTRIAFDAANAFFAGAFNIAEDNQALFALDSNLATIKRLTAKVNDFGRNTVSTEITHQYRPELLPEDEFITDFYVTRDEKNIYAISATSEWLSFDGATFIDNGLLNTDENIINLALNHTSNDRPHYTRFNPDTGFVIDVYDEQQTVVATVELGNNQPSSVTVSADDNRAIVRSDSEDTIEVVTLAQYTSSADTVEFTTNLGDSVIAQQEITLSGVGRDWQATSSEPWLIVTPQTVDDIDSILLNIDRSLITGWGVMTASISIYDPASGTTRVITVTLAIDAIRLASNYPALAFNSLATEQQLVHTIKILSNSESPIAWQASTDASWLSLSVDTVNNTLTVTAIPANAPSDGLHNAEITISAVDPTQALSGVINVNLNRATVDSVDVDIAALTINSAGLVIDPTRPYFYVATGDQIRTYHVVTGALVNTATSPVADLDLTNLVIHPDGSMLLASNSETYLDEDEIEQTRVNHYRFDLSSRLFSQIAADDITIEYRPVMITMIAGAAVVVTQTLEFADINLVRQAWDQDNVYFTSTMAGANANDIISAYKQADSTIERYGLEYNAYAAQMVTASAEESYNNAVITSLSSLALSSNANILYTANSSSEWTTFDGNSYADQGLLHGDANITTLNTVVDSADNSYFYRFDPLKGFTYSKYDDNQVEVWTETLTTGSVQNYLMPDYQRVLSYNTATSTLSIRANQ
jgi:hypothetical protein